MTTEFQEKVYALLRKVPEGKVSSYGEIARALGSSSRAVGQACRCNPYAPGVPCHRIVRSDGSVGGFGGVTSGPEVQRKIRMLRGEGIAIHDGRIDLAEHGFTF